MGNYVQYIICIHEKHYLLLTLNTPDIRPKDAPRNAHLIKIQDIYVPVFLS